MQFANWIDTLVEEKNLDPEHIFEVEGKSGVTSPRTKVRGFSFPIQAAQCAV